MRFVLQVGRQQFDPGGVPAVDPKRGCPAAATTAAGGGGGGGVTRSRSHATPGNAAVGLGHRLQRHNLWHETKTATAPGHVLQRGGFRCHSLNGKQKTRTSVYEMPPALSSIALITINDTK